MKMEFLEGELTLVNNEKIYNKAANQRNVYFVLGMHRSATSLTAEILSEIGLYMGDKEDMLEPDNENKDGYFEIRKVVELNDDILLENNMVWCCVKSSPIDLKTQKGYLIKSNIIELFDKSGERDIAIKDPRFCILEPFWRNEIKNLKLNPKIIVVVRHPYEVAKSLVKRDGIEFDYALKIWFYYNCCILNIIAQYPSGDILFLNHQDFFSDNSQFEKILYFCNRDYEEYDKKNIIKKELRHNYSKSIQCERNELHNYIFELYDFMVDVSRNNIVLTKDIIDKFNIYLKRISCISYRKDNKDMFFAAMYHCHHAWLKKWCLNLLEKEKDNFILFFNNFCLLRKVNNIILYGYGTIGKIILEILKHTGIECIGLIDKNISVDFCDSICVYNKIPENLPQNVYILNTVVNYEDEINLIVSSLLIKEKYISLKEIIYYFWEKNKTEKKDGFDIFL